MPKSKILSSLLVLATVAMIDRSSASFAETIIGANSLGVDLASAQRQDMVIQQYTENGVKTIRTGLGGHGDGYTNFVIKAFQHGLGAVVILSPTEGNTGNHALPPDAAAGRPFGLPALSDADPDGFRKWFQVEIDKLETAGVRITAFELGNELNTSRFNADFRPEQVTGKMLGIAELNNGRDPVGSTVATGYLAYLKVMEALKDIRDHSKLNQTTPILSGMSANWGSNGIRMPDSIEYLRQHGMDKLADGYAVHIYPSNDPRMSVSDRIAALEKDGVFAGCHQGTKPCWLTEWGVNNPSQTCPIDDTTRAKVVEAERSAFKHYIDQGRVAALLYYSWSGLVPYSWQEKDTNRKEDAGAIFRCGQLTEAGKIAMSPIP